MSARDLSQMVPRYFIGFEKTEERFVQLTTFLRRTGVHRIILFSSGFLEESSIFPPEYYLDHARLIKPYVEQLREMGVEVGINVLNSVGHAYYADETEFGFTRAVTVDGEPSRGCACIRHQPLIEYIKQQYRHYAALHPSVIFTDDDIRAISVGQLICLCPDHVRLISRRVGQPLTREEIYTHIHGSSFDSDPIRQAYFDQIKEDVEYLIGEIADSVHEISPETEIGVMTTSYPSVTLDRDLSTFFDTLGQKKVTRIRTGMDYYREGDHGDIPMMFSMPAIQREFLNDAPVEIQPEIENDTYGFFYKSNTVTHMQLVWCLTNGFRNMQLNLFDALDCPSWNFEEVSHAIAGHMPFYDALTRLIPENHRTDGVGIYVHPRALSRRRMIWHRVNIPLNCAPPTKTGKAVPPPTVVF